MSFDQWAENYFGKDVVFPRACYDAWNAARAEALREAAEFASGTTAYVQFQSVEHHKLAYKISEELRAMADREGK